MSRDEYRLQNLGGGVYRLWPSGWYVKRDTWASANIWTVSDARKKEMFHRTTRREAVEVAIGMLREQDEAYQ